MGASTAQALRSQFSGLWHLQRDIFDLDSQWTGRFEGQARLSNFGLGLLYQEIGDLRFAGLQDVRASHSYRWDVFNSGRIAVFHDDGRFFYAFNAIAKRDDVMVLQKDAVMDIAFVAGAKGQWRTEWRVEGRAKNYRMVSQYSRQAFAPEAPLG